ncbi:CLUMA_CG001913, isoform A [Clunio marinus]|uniref:CLUMA_CG001913, isoform A n=1 Tax=Clunio marinus TaxID=568069 RepID=A0A1J1HJA5_9DIPT|nr:CLUMA_CG001913, isoform A [Clunio marinus]
MLINKLSREYLTPNLFDSTATSCNNLNNDVESSIMIEDSLKSLLDFTCTDLCQLAILSNIYNHLKCSQADNYMRRLRRNNLDLFGKEDLFLPVRGRRILPAPNQIRAEKKGRFDILQSELFLPHRGRRDMTPKKFINLGTKRNDIEFNEDYFVPNRGKRQAQIDEELFLDNFFPQRGKKVIIQNSHMPFVKYPRDRWLFRNINSDVSNMIDRPKQDLNLLGSEANKDITVTALPTLYEMREKAIPAWKNKPTMDQQTAMIFNPFNDEFTESDGEATNLILTNTPHIDVPPNGFTSK